jgi:hypothetical protein
MPITYTVLENGHPCEYKEGQHKYWQDWSNATFPTYEQAIDYAREWFDFYADDWTYENMKDKLNKPYCFNGWDFMEIRENKSE